MPPRPDISVFILLWSCNLENLFVTVTHRWDEKALWGDGGGGRESCLVQELWPGSTTIRQRGKIKLISKTVHMYCTVFLNFFLVRRVYVQMPKHVWDSISWKYLHKYTLLPHSPSVTPAQRQFLGWRYRIPVLSCHSSRIHCILHKCGLSCFPVGLPKRKEAERKSSHLLCLSDPWHPLQLCSGSPNPANGNVTPFYLPFISEPSGSAWPTVWISHFFEKLWKRERSENRDDQAWHTQISCKIISSKLMSPSSQPFPQLLWRI